MPFKFRKSIKIAPGVKINLSKSGVSTSIGGKGHNVNVGKRGVKTTVGIPGTGVSYTTASQTSHQKATKNKGCGTTVALLIFVVLLTLALILTAIL